MITKKNTSAAPSSLSCSPVRGQYGELIGDGVAAILKFLGPALPETFCAFDKKGRGDALNVELYSWDADQSVGVVQLRHAYRRYANSQFLTVHKTYVLCGFNETGEPFRHPISSHTVRAACRRNVTLEAGVTAAQKWMWGVTDKQLAESRRQGDVLIVSHRGNPKSGDFESLGNTLILAGTHIVEADEIVKIPGKSWVFAKNPVLRHTKHQHRDTRAPLSDSVWFTIRVAYEERSWDFSQRLGD